MTRNIRPQRGACQASPSAVSLAGEGGPNVNIRPLCLPDDVEALSHLNVASTADTVLNVAATATGFSFTETPVSLPLSKNHDFLADVTSADRQWADGFVACDGAHITGFAATGYWRWNRRQVLWHLYVDRAHRGRGIARGLVEHVLNLGRANGARQVWLETQNTNTPAVRAYQAMGFEIVGLDRTLYDGDTAHETALYLAKPLVSTSEHR